jgi:hypothetical protein
MAPGNEIDIYLRPLIDDLHELWDEGISTYDALTKETFKLQRMETYLGGLPREVLHVRCVTRIQHSRLTYENKMCYMGHRRWLPRGHIWRRKGELFDGTEEHRLAPKELSNDELLRQLDHVTGV